MRALGRWASNLAVVASLVLCVAASLIWANTRLVVEQSTYRDLDIRMRIGRGQVSVEWPNPSGANTRSPEILKRAGFGFERTSTVGVFGHERSALWAPTWLLWAIFIYPPVWWFLRRGWHHAKPGLCTACGYNLTGNTSGTCPECGTAVTA
jgi:hypothetical protein